MQKKSTILKHVNGNEISKRLEKAKYTGRVYLEQKQNVWRIYVAYF